MPPTCQLSVQSLAQCRETLSRFHRMEQAEQWLVAGFLGAGLIIAWLVFSALKHRSFRNGAPETLLAPKTVDG